MKRDVISDLFLILWFQKDSLDTIGLGLMAGVQSPKPKSDIWSPNCAYGGGGGGGRGGHRLR